ncbi:methyltransferase domain-containing protein [Thermodesulfobacteriota bacterium]
MEIGCNIGYGAKILGKFAREVVAVDLDTKALNYARKNCVHQIYFLMN